MKKISYLFFSVIFACSSLLSQSNNIETQITLPAAIEQALKNNPRIKAAHQEWKSELETIPQVKALPDPVLSFALFGQSIETRLGPQNTRFSLSQKLPFFGKLKIKGEIAESQTAVLEEQYLKTRADVILQVKEVFFTLSWYEETIRITEQEKEILNNLARTAEKKYETGRGSQQDILKVQLEISKSINKLLQLSQGRNAAAAKLNSILNLPPGNSLEPIIGGQSPPLNVELPALYAWAEKERPELKIAQQYIDKNETKLTQAKKDYYPDFNLKFDYITIGGGSTTHSRDGQREAQAQIKLNASRASLQDIRNSTMAAINELYLEIKTLEEQIELYEHTLLPQAEQSVKASEIGYVAGKVDFLNLLDGERTILHIKTGYQKLLIDREKSRARLERIVGRDLRREK